MPWWDELLAAVRDDYRAVAGPAAAGPAATLQQADALLARLAAELDAVTGRTALARHRLRQARQAADATAMARETATVEESTAQLERLRTLQQRIAAQRTQLLQRQRELARGAAADAG